MPSDQFRMDHGEGMWSILRRQPSVVGSMRMVWRDAEGFPAEGYDEDVDGHPVDVFGLPLFGQFVNSSTQKC